MSTGKAWLVSLSALCWLICAPQAQGAMQTTDPSLPPVGGSYQGDPLSQVAVYGIFKVTEIRLTDFNNITRWLNGSDQVLEFHVTLTGQLTEPAAMPVTLQGPLTARVFGKGTDTTGSWQAEIESADCSGSMGIMTGMLRESPTLVSQGRITVTDLGGGLYNIDSFFDIYTELSPDGGSTWVPDANGPHRMVLVPEPAAVSLLALGALGAIRRRGRWGA